MKNLKNNNIVDSNYADELSQQNALVAKRKVNEQLPPLNQTQKTALYHRGLSDSCTRGVEFLFSNQGARTDIISASCAIGNVSDCFIGLRGANTEKLEAIGLAVECMKISAKNRFNRKTCIGTWWLKVIDSELWEKAQAAALSHLQECANDSKYAAKGE